MKIAPIVFAPLIVLTACTSVKVNKLAEGKRQKVPARQVQQISVEAAKSRPHEKLATIDMRTRSPFAADLNQLARERTGKLGGNAYSILSGNSQTTVSGGVGSLLGDSTSASLSIEVLRWADVSLPEPAQKKKAPAASPQPSPAPATKPAKTKAWWRPWSWF